MALLPLAAKQDRMPQLEPASSRYGPQRKEPIRMKYHASQTLQLTTPDGLNPASRVHEMRDDGTPLCGTPARELRGTPVVYTRQGPGDVTCLRCARSHTKP
jgi:hypothetical protein